MAAAYCKICGGGIVKCKTCNGSGNYGGTGYCTECNDTGRLCPKDRGFWQGE